ncbi:hypothetical protein F4801DRAFT_544153 [Xylaria longipes]|nr:hypothetical protein F4801DRAFT_544153 [Xylaria longipes]
MADSKDTLRQITKRHKKPIVSLLLDIQRYQALQQQFLCFLYDLECFSVKGDEGTRLYRHRINAFEETDYVALSYTWDPSQYENPRNKGYSVKDRSRKREFPSPVRDCVFERITKYMHCKGVKLLWIDRHSLPQQICKSSACDRRNPKHEKCHKKRAGLQCMDWVYKLSKHPVALLGRPLKLRRELTLLHKILKGKLVNQSDRADQPQLLQGRNLQQAKDALKLLFAITSDLWWQRAWTFQENYKGGKDMTLLIRHARSLEGYKRRSRTFGYVPGEVCVNSRLFSDQATELCVAFRSTKHITPKEEEMIRSVLSRAGKYTVLLEKSQIMSPKIIADVEERDVRDVWDRLAIVGNCCSYSVRMDIERLRQDDHSLSLSMLAMCLLNGEILDNRPSGGHTASNLTVSRFLKVQSFDKMSSPLEQRSLTFNKGSRFTDVKLHESGILTKGHLWKLGRIIQTGHFSNRLPWVESPGGELELCKVT